MRALSYPRRQQYRRLSRAVRSGALAAIAGALALVAGEAQMGGIALALGVVTVVLVGRSARWFGLASRSRIGADSERRVRRELQTLEREGWHAHHSVRWHRGGDLDHVAIAPAGIAFAIETKTRSYASGDLARICEIADWLTRRRGSWCAGDAIPVLCLAGARRIERLEGAVLVASLDRLVPVLRRLAGTTPRPLFLS